MWPPPGPPHKSAACAWHARRRAQGVAWSLRMALAGPPDMRNVRLSAAALTSDAAEAVTVVIASAITPAQIPLERFTWTGMRRPPCLEESGPGRRAALRKGVRRRQCPAGALRDARRFDPAPVEDPDRLRGWAAQDRARAADRRTSRCRASTAAGTAAGVWSRSIQPGPRFPPSCSDHSPAPDEDCRRS